MFKALYLSYPEGKRHLAEADRMLQGTRGPAAGSDPAGERVVAGGRLGKAAEVRLQREIALLRIFEALRMHAAAKGELPESLKDVTVAVIPLDPARDEPFVYHRLDRQTAISK